MNMENNPPLPLKILAVLLWLKAAMLLVMIALYMFLLKDFEAGSFMEGFKKGLLSGSGIDPEGYTPNLAGQMCGGLFVYGVFVALAIFCLKKKKFIGLNIALVLNLFSTLVAPGLSTIFSLLMLVLPWNKSARQYLRPAKAAALPGETPA